MDYQIAQPSYWASFKRPDYPVKHLSGGEAQSAESKKDFIHKISIVMKELRETQINLSIIGRLEMFSGDKKINELMTENDQLLAIFFRTMQTAKNNLRKINN